MRLAALYDIHGNLRALEAVLKDVEQEHKDRQIDEIIVGGDVVIGPQATEVLARLRQCNIPQQYIYGNCEIDVLIERGGTESQRVPEQFRELFRWNGQQLSDDDAKWMATWPKTLQRSVDKLGEVLFCHGTPRDENEIFTRQSPESRLGEIFAEVSAPIIVCGHTHMQFDRGIAGTRILNAGSVGMGFGPRGADWLLLGPDVEFRQTEYDFEVAAEQIRQTNYPAAEEFADVYVLNPPSEEQMLAAYGFADEQ